MIHRDRVTIRYWLGGIEHTVNTRATVVADSTTTEAADGTMHRTSAPRYRVLLPPGPFKENLTQAARAYADWLDLRLTLDVPILAYTRLGRIRHYEAVSRLIGKGPLEPVDTDD